MAWIVGKDTIPITDTETIALDESLTAQRWQVLPCFSEIQDYIKSGSPDALSVIKSAALRGDYDAGEVAHDTWWFNSLLLRKLSLPLSLEDRDRRMLHILLALGHRESIARRWFNAALKEEDENQNIHAILRRVFLDQGLDEKGFAQFTVEHVTPLARNEWPNSAGRYLQRLDDETLEQVIRDLEDDAAALELLAFLLDHAKKRVPSLVDRFFESKANPEALPEICRLLIARGGDAYEESVLGVFGRLRDDWERFRVCTFLADFRPEEYRDDALQRAYSYFQDLSWLADGVDSFNIKVFLEVTSCLVCHQTRDVLLDLLPFLSTPSKGVPFESCWQETLLEETSQIFGEKLVQPVVEEVKAARSQPTELELYETLKRIALNKAVKHLGRECLPAVIAAIDAGDLTTRIEGLIHLLDREDRKLDNIVNTEIQRGLREGCEIEVLRFLGLVKHLGVGSFLDDVLALVGRRNRAIRKEAVRILSKLGDEVLPSAEALLGAESRLQRLGAVQLLLATKASSVLKILDARLDHEEDSEVRKAIRLVLDAAGRRGSGGGGELPKRIERAGAGIKEFRIKWLDPENLPSLQFKNGEVLDDDTVLYLLYRQSRVKDIRPDISAKVVYDLIDRERSGDFSLHLLDAFLNSGANARDRWALAVAAILGDERCIPVLARQVDRWVDRKRGKMAQYAVSALALQGSDRALAIVNTLASRYRTKFESVGKVASEVLRETARERGMLAQVLGDRLVPRFGFEAGKSRVLVSGKQRFEALLGSDHRLRILDLKTHRTVSTLPTSAAKKLRRGFTELKTILAQAIKAESARIEYLFVTQYRWPVEDWSKLYVKHPLLLPFAVQLVWGYYDDSGELQATFCAREDATLTDIKGKSVELPDDGVVGVVHPLELTDRLIQGWSRHASGCKRVPPFPQLDRAVVRPRPAENRLKLYKDLYGMSVNGRELENHAKKLGWRHSALQGTASFNTYIQSFPLARVDAFLVTGGLPVVDNDVRVGLFDAYFAETGSLDTAGNSSEAPEGENDPRLIPFERVPPVVFSETMVDLQRIAGRCEKASRDRPMFS